MIYYSRGAALRLCWLLSFVISCIQCQFLSSNAIAAKLEELRAHGLPIPVDFDGTLTDGLHPPGGGKIPGEAQFPYNPSPSRGVMPESTRSTDLPAEVTSPKSTAPPSSLPARPSSLPATISIVESIAQKSTLPEDIPTTESMTLPGILPVVIPSLAIPFVSPASTLGVATPTLEPSTSSATNSMAPSTSATSPLASPTVQPLPSPFPTAAEENNAPTTSSSPTPTTPSNTASNPNSMAGLGVGLSFGVLSITGAAGFFLYRRRRLQNQQHDNDTEKSEQRTFLRRIFGPKTYMDNKGDPEWSIESAEHVSVGKNMRRAQSVRTTSSKDTNTSRSDSRDEDSSKSGGSAGNGGLIAKGSVMMPPRKKKLSLPNTALGSHPVRPDLEAFPVPPVGVAGRRVGGSMDVEGERGNWPLAG